MKLAQGAGYTFKALSLEASGAGERGRGLGDGMDVPK